MSLVFLKCQCIYMYIPIHFSIHFSLSPGSPSHMMEPIFGHCKIRHSLGKQKWGHLNKQDTFVLQVLKSGHLTNEETFFCLNCVQIISLLVFPPPYTHTHTHTYTYTHTCSGVSPHCKTLRPLVYLSPTNKLYSTFF